MPDNLQFILSIFIIAFCIFGGITLLLRAYDNRAKQILGWSMIKWAVLMLLITYLRCSVCDRYCIFHPDILMTGAFVVASLACYVVEVLRPGYLSWSRFFVLISPLLLTVSGYILYRVNGGEVRLYSSIRELLGQMNLDYLFRMLFFLITVSYMILPLYLVLRYSEERESFLKEVVSDPENYDLKWLKKIIVTLWIMYIFYIMVLLINDPILYIIDKVIILFIWYYLFYNALFLKVLPIEFYFVRGWDIPRAKKGAYEDPSNNFLLKDYAEQIKNWFDKDKPYLREDLRLTDLQRIFPIGRSYLSRLFNKELGQSFSDYVNFHRVQESIRLMEAEPCTSLQEIAEKSGFYSISTFRRAFMKHTGQIPSEYKKV